MKRADMQPLTMVSRVETYITMRRRAGFAPQASMLMSFARFSDEFGHRGPLTLRLATRWAHAARHPKPVTCATRLAMLRPFALFQQQLEPRTEVPPRDLFVYRRVTPHIYTSQEITTLLRAAAQLSPKYGLRMRSIAALLGLLAATGLRLSEALHLERADVDLPQRRLLVRQSKFHKSRWVPLHRTTVCALRAYARDRDRQLPLDGVHAPFFPDEHGSSLTTGKMQYAFRQLRAKLGWRSRGGHPAPRIHDLRHTFVCRRLQRWYQQRVRLDRAFLALSTYVGHVQVSSTYWYLTTTPELMGLAAGRFERFLKTGVPAGGDA